MSSNWVRRKEVETILEKINRLCDEEGIIRDPKVKPLSDYELASLPELPSEWGWVISNDISTFITNGVHSPTSPEDKLGINKRMLRITDLQDNREPDFEVLPYCQRFTKNDYDKTIKKNDIYISFTGNVLGKRYIVKETREDVVFAHYFVRWQPLIVNPKYIYYVLLSHHFERFMYENTLGSTQPNLKVTSLKRVPLPLAPLSEQEKIAKVFSDIDEKIEVNSKINKTLESMAQEIFKQWFIEFEFPNKDGEPYKSSGGEMTESEIGMIPNGWEINTIGNCANLVTRGISPKYADVSEQYVINQKCIRDGSLSTVLARPHCSVVNKDKVLQFGDVLINSTGVGTLGRVAQVYENLVNYTVDSHVTIVRPNSENKISYLGCLLRNMQTKFENAGTGSTGQTELNRDIIKQMQIIVPSDSILEKFSSIYDSIYNKLVHGKRENLLLLNLRNTLLPKLMSGEIRVPVDGGREKSLSLNL